MARSTNKRTEASGDAKFVCTDSKILESGRVMNTLILEGEEPVRCPFQGIFKAGKVYHLFGTLNLKDPRSGFGKELILTKSMVNVIETFTSERGVEYLTIEVK